MLEAIYSATRAEIRRYSNLDWTITTFGLVLLSSLLFVSRQPLIQGSAVLKAFLVFAVIFVSTFFIFTRGYIQRRLNEERELQRCIEVEWSESLERLEGKLLCHRIEKPISLGFNPWWMIGHSVILLLYAFYIVMEVLSAP